MSMCQVALLPCKNRGGTRCRHGAEAVELRIGLTERVLAVPTTRHHARYRPVSSFARAPLFPPVRDTGLESQSGPSACARPRACAHSPRKAYHKASRGAQLRPPASAGTLPHWLRLASPTPQHCAGEAHVPGKSTRALLGVPLAAPRRDQSRTHVECEGCGPVTFRPENRRPCWRHLCGAGQSLSKIEYFRDTPTGIPLGHWNPP